MVSLAKNDFFVNIEFSLSSYTGEGHIFLVYSMSEIAAFTGLDHKQQPHFQLLILD